MASPRWSTLAAVLLVLLIGGCSGSKADKEFERQLEICSAGEKNGVLETAADACGRALAIAKEREYSPDEISDLSYRLGKIERNRGRFAEAEVLLQASLEFEAQATDPAEMASRLVELSFSLAGQDRWEEGAALLNRAEPHVRGLEGGDRKAAFNAFRGYAAQLGKLGDGETAARFKALADELAAP